MTSISIVEDALDQYVAYFGSRGIDPAGVRVATLAKLVDVTPAQMSQAVQAYRQAQVRDGATRYVIGCREYGRNARWSILAKPSTDPKVVQRARVEQARWITKDAVTRFAKDRLLEVNPSLTGKGKDPVIEHATAYAAEQLESMARFVENILAANGVRPA